MADIEKKMMGIINQGAEPPKDKNKKEEQTAEPVRCAVAGHKEESGTGAQETEDNTLITEEETTGKDTTERQAGEDAGKEDTGKDVSEDGVDYSRFPNTPIEKQKRYNMQNLVVSLERTPEERREYARRAGKASAEARRGKKNLQELLNVLLSAPATPEMVARAQALGIDAKDATTLYDALNVAQIEQALKGNGYAFQLIRDSAGDRPTEKVEQAVSVMTEKDLEMMRKLDARLKKSATDGQK